MRNLVILPGGGSPYSNKYEGVYDLIKTSSKSTDFEPILLDYVGIGHYPKYGTGLRLLEAVEKNEKAIENVNKNSILFCRSFGCYIAAYLLANKPSVMENYSKILFWGPTSYHHQWYLFGKNDINSVNLELKSKGLSLAQDYLKTLIPIEYMAQYFSGEKSIKIGFGTLEQHSTEDFCNYLSSIINGRTNCCSKVKVIEGLGHEVTDQCATELVKKYLDFLFDID